LLHQNSNYMKTKFLPSLLIFLCMFCASCKVRVQSLSIIHGIEVEQIELYKSLIPTGANMPDTPLVKFEAVAPKNTSFYLESNISIRLVYKNEYYWYPLIMPLNNNFGYMGGLPYGYPKVLVDIARQKTLLDGKVQYEFLIDASRGKDGSDSNTCVLGTYFKELRSIEKTSYWTDEFVREQGLSITKESIWVSTFLKYKSKSKEVYYGEAKLVNRYNTPWSQLLKSGVYKAIFVDASITNLQMMTTDINTGEPFKP
jgi:Acetoacetate decarboxylase (ADC)